MSGKIANNNEIKAVIFDWAGTTVDYGCFAPLDAFMESFANKGIIITIDEARAPMGLPKIDHIREIFRMPRVSELFLQKYEYAHKSNSDNSFQMTFLLDLALRLFCNHKCHHLF